MVLEIGRLCVKIAGRDGGNKCAIIDILDKNYVVIDGNVRRKKCNIAHLVPLDKTLEIKKNASTEEVLAAFEKEKIEVLKKEKKEPTKKEAKTRPVKKKAAKKE